jgi:hypothetical protein
MSIQDPNSLHLATGKNCEVACLSAESALSLLGRGRGDVRRRLVRTAAERAAADQQRTGGAVAFAAAAPPLTFGEDLSHCKVDADGISAAAATWSNTTCSVVTTASCSRCLQVTAGRRRAFKCPLSRSSPFTRFVSFFLDLYQITMAYAYWKAKRTSDVATFDLFFRKNPFHGEFTVFAGLSECVKFVESFRYSESGESWLFTSGNKMLEE